MNKIMNTLSGHLCQGLNKEQVNSRKEKKCLLSKLSMGHVIV